MGIYLGAAMLAGAAGSALLGPAPAGAVNRDIVDLQQTVNQLLQGQQTLQTAVTQNDAVERTMISQAVDTVNKLNGSMGALQKSVQDLQATSGARLDSMATQIQGVSDNLQETLARMGKLNQQLTDAQNAIQAIDAKLAKLAAPAPAPCATAPRCSAPLRQHPADRRTAPRTTPAFAPAPLRSPAPHAPRHRLPPTCSTPTGCAI